MVCLKQQALPLEDKIGLHSLSDDAAYCIANDIMSIYSPVNYILIVTKLHFVMCISVGELNAAGANGIWPKIRFKYGRSGMYVSP